MVTRLHTDQQGGAVVELAIASVVFVPLIMFGAWFSDVAHWKLKLEEASVGATLDLTAWKVHDFSKTHPDFGQLYQSAVDGVTQGPDSIPGRMRTSFDSAKPGAFTYTESVFVLPKNLRVSCSDFLGGKPSSRIENFTMNEGRPGEEAPELNKHAWVTCKASARMKTAGLPETYQEMNSVQWFFRPSWASFKLCGVGPGAQGCGAARADGLSIMLDDWALSGAGHHEGADVPLSMIGWWHPRPDGTDPGDTVQPSVQEGARNVDYAAMVKRFWRTPGENAGDGAMTSAMAIAGAREMGYTDSFHISYRYDGEHRYGIYAQEQRDGQKGAYGGPDGVERQDPHTGGPWHERNPVGSDGDMDGLSKRTWDARDGSDHAEHYMGVPSWPEDH